MFGAPDDAGAAKIKARQAREAVRRETLLDARKRTMAVDKDYLKQQKKEKRMAKKKEKADDLMMAQQTAQWNQMLSNYEGRQMMEKKEAQQLLQMEWKKQSMMRSKRSETWDLNDPDALRNAKPARVGDDDPRCGPSSMQMFAGERGQDPALQRQQREELNAYLQKQIDERREAAQREKMADRAYGQQQVAVAQMVSAAEFEDMADASRARLDVANENRVRAAAVRRNRKSMKEQEDALSQLEMQYQRKSKLLKGQSGAHKGMTAADLADIHRVQAMQREELQARRDNAKREQEQYDARLIQNVKLMNKLEFDAMQEGKRAALEYSSQLQLQGAQSRRAAKAASIAETNKDYGDYNASFGRGAR